VRPSPSRGDGTAPLGPDAAPPTTGAGVCLRAGAGGKRRAHCAQCVASSWFSALQDGQ
jgi:hypothetical protein